MLIEYRNGYPIKVMGIHAIERYAKEKRALVCPGFGAFDKPKPAAVIINLPGAIILRMIDHGLYVYITHKKLMEASK